MGVIIKYVVDFPKAGFKVSNDILKGDFLIDASVSAKMMSGPDGGTFEIKLYNLPEGKASDLYKKQDDPKEARVTIKLGYMDGEFDTVMEGIYRTVDAKVDGDNLITTIIGQESGMYVLQNTRFQKNIEGKIPLKDAVTKLLHDAFPSSAAPSASTGLAAVVASLLGNGAASGDLLDTVPTVQNVTAEVEDPSMKGERLIDILDTLTKKADAELLISDKKVRIGKPITNDDYQPAEFDRDVNLAVFRPIAKTLPGEEGDNRLIKLPPNQAFGFNFTVTGDPHLRPAQKVYANVETKVAGQVEGYRKKNGAEFRIVALEHNLSLSGGYVCTGKAAKVCTDNNNSRRQQDALCMNGPDSLIRRLSQQNKDDRAKNPTVEVGTVKQYNPGAADTAPHRSTLYFGQRYAKTETQPSVRAEVDADDKQVFRNKPIVSPFAWHKCGLVVPVYPGMKAMLTHNLSISDDALVTGFLWSEKPPLAPPKNKEGDWWLCLPIDFDSSGPPHDDTKAANDLTANNGKRVIQVKGLKITIGKDLLGAVGVRPDEGTDDEFLIEHKSGANFKIAADGSLTIKAKSVSIDADDSLTMNAKSVSIKGDVAIKGKLAIE